MTWVISGPIAVAAEVVDTDTGERRDVQFQVPASDQAFADEVTPRWLKSFPELAWRDANPQENTA